MEDYNSNLLNDSKSEWSIRLMNILCGHVIDGFRSIFNESIEVCDTNDEPEKYLMTFQNFLSRIPKWNQVMIEKECERIKECSKCDYLEDLITCVHIIQLKILSCVRTNNQVKKIDIDIPQFSVFLHNVYINIARKLYSNIYLFQVDASPLEQQKNNREFEVIVQSCILNTVRDNIPIDHLLKQYMDETQEEDVIREKKIIKPEKAEPEPEKVVSNEVVKEEPMEPNKISFEQNVEKYDPVNQETTNEAINFEPKEEPRSLYDDEEDDYEKLTIGEPISLNIAEDLEKPVKEEPPKEEMIPIDLNSVDIQEEPPTPKSDVIDLGIEELTF
ncbi:MAG: hypothetical protein CMP11_00315 [Zetaproteobacteria bacterium]|nr:hypothetical protein [Pseudobdellovibrionaceae bacterium]